MSARVVSICFLLLLAPLRALANAAPNVVTDWATIVQGVIHNAAAPRSAGTSQILHTMVMLAVYDAVVAIEGGYESFGAAIDAAPGADVRAAVRLDSGLLADLGGSSVASNAPSILINVGRGATEQNRIRRPSFVVR